MSSKESTCTLHVEYHSYGRRCHEDNYEVEITELQWECIRGITNVFSKLTKKCSDSQALFTALECSDNIIKLKCSDPQCISPVKRLAWIHKVKSHFKESAATLIIREHKLSEQNCNAIYMGLKQIPNVESCDAVVVKGEDCMIFVATISSNDAQVSADVKIVLDKHDISDSDSSGYTSLGNCSIPSSHLCIVTFTFQGRKLKLLRECPTVRDYLARSVSGGFVRFEVGSDSKEFKLVATEEHQDEAKSFLALLQTRDIIVSDTDAALKEVEKRHANFKDKLLLETDEEDSNVLSITTTDDVFDSIIQTVAQFREISHKYETDKRDLNITRPTKTRTTSSKSDDDSVFLCQNSELHKSSNTARTPRARGTAKLSGELTHLLSTSDDTFDSVADILKEHGVRIEITPDGGITYVAPSGIEQKTIDELIDNCFSYQTVNFKISPIGSYLTPSQAESAMKSFLGDRSEKVLIQISGDTMTLIFTKDIAESLHQFLDGYTHIERTFNLDKETSKQFWFDPSKLQSLQKAHKKHKVRIHVCHTGSNIRVTGSQIGVASCCNKIQRMLQSTASDMKLENVTSPDVKNKAELNHGRKFISVNDNPDSCTRTRSIHGNTEHGKFKMNLPIDMASRLSGDRRAMEYVRKVFQHEGFDIEAFPSHSELVLRSIHNSPNVETLQSRKQALINKNQISSSKMLDALKTMQPELVSNLILYSDAEKEKLVVVGCSEYVDQCLVVMKDIFNR